MRTADVTFESGRGFGVISSNGGSVAVLTPGCGCVSIQLAGGPWTGTLKVQVTGDDGATWTDVNAIRVSTAPAAVPTIAANGLFAVPIMGQGQLQVLATSWTSGAVTVTLDASEVDVSAAAAAASIDAKTPSLGQKTSVGSVPVVLASDQPSVPVTASSLPLPAGAATAANQASGNATLVSIDGKLPTQGQKTGAGSVPVVLASDQGAVPVSAASLPLPSGAATEATLSTRLADATVTARLGTLGQKAAAGSAPVVIASDQTEVLASIDAKTPALGLKGAAASSPVVLASEHLDAFSRIRTAGAVTIFDNQQQYGDSALTWENALTGTGAVSNLLNESTVQLTTGGTGSGAQVIRQTRQCMRYQPGKSQLAFLTFCLDGGAKANVRRRVGYFDANDGVFFELNGSTANVVRRTSTSGSPVDEVVPQSSWNLDKLDGNGASGITLDVSKVHILVVDLQWLGVGRVRVGFDLGGVVVYVHQFLHANVITSVYMKTANLPVRFEVTNTGVAASATTMRQICCAIVSEGGVEDARALQFAAGRGATTLGVTTRRPVLSLRAKTTGPNGVRNTGIIRPVAASLFAGANTAYYEIVVGGTLTGAAFAAFDATNSIAEIDTSATAISGGNVVEIGYCPSGAANSPSSKDDRFYRDFALVYSSLLNVQDVVSVVVTSTSGTTNVLADMTWRELSL
jgi:hypothetical protein